MTGKFMTRLVQQTLKRNPLLGQPALQCPSAQVQLAREILYRRTLNDEQLLQNALRLFFKSLLCQLLGQFGLKLRCDRGEQIRVVSYKREFDTATGVPVLIEAGLGNSGTVAASELVTSGGITTSLANEPSCKGKSNFEAVIGTQIIDTKSGPPHVLRLTCW